MRFFAVSLFLVFLLGAIMLANQQAFAHRDFPSDGRAYHTIVTLKQISFHAGASDYDLTSNNDYVFGWRVELNGHPIPTNTGTFVDENSEGAILKHESVVIDHIECGPKSSLQFYGWAVESDQKNILGTDKMMKETIKSPDPSGNKVTAKHVFESAGDTFIGFQSDLVAADDEASDELFEENLFLDAKKTVEMQFVVDRIVMWDDNKCKTTTETPSDKIIKKGTDVPITKKPQPEDKNSKTKKSDTQIKISSEDLKTLYIVSKRQEAAAASLLNLNDQEDKVLKQITAGQSKEQKTVAKSLDSIIKKQSTDKKTTKNIQDVTKKISSEIQKIAKKQGVSLTTLEKTIKTTQKAGKPQQATPASQLKQGVDDAKTNLDESRKLQDKHDSGLEIDAMFLAVLGSDDRPNPDDEALKNMHIRIIQDGTVKLQPKTEEETLEESNQNVMSLLQQALDILLKEEQSQVTSILDTIPEPTLKDKFVQTTPTKDAKPVIKQDPSTVTKPDTTTQKQSNATPQMTIPKQVTQEATSSSGAAVSYNISASDKEDGAITPSCDHSSGSTFPIGSTTVSCTVTDSNNNSISGKFTVTVRDTTPPSIPAFQPTEGTRDETGVVVFFEVTAYDLVDGNIPANCNYPSGTKFPIGVTVLTCTADDSRGNHASRSLQITVTKTESG